MYPRGAWHQQRSEVPSGQRGFEKEQAQLEGDIKRDVAQIQQRGALDIKKDYLDQVYNIKRNEAAGNQELLKQIEEDYQKDLNLYLVRGLDVSDIYNVVKGDEIQSTILQQAEDYVENNLAKFSEDLLRAYVQESLTDAPEYKEQLDSIFRNLVMKSAKQVLTPHLEGLSKEKFKQVLSSQVNKAVTNEVERINEYPEMLAQVNASVKATLRSDDFKLLRNVIGPRLQIIQQRLREEIAQNAERSIKAVKSALPEDKIFDKRGYSELEEIINDIKSRPLFPDESFALRFFIAAESGKKHKYDQGLIFAYLEALEKGLGDNFRFALILDRRMKFVALAEVEEFKTALQIRSSAPNLVNVLNDKVYVGKTDTIRWTLFFSLIYISLLCLVQKESPFVLKFLYETSISSLISISIEIRMER